MFEGVSVPLLLQVIRSCRFYSEKQYMLYFSETSKLHGSCSGEWLCPDPTEGASFSKSCRMEKGCYYTLHQWKEALSHPCCRQHIVYIMGKKDLSCLYWRHENIVWEIRETSEGLPQHWPRHKSHKLCWREGSPDLTPWSRQAEAGNISINDWQWHHQ